MMPGVSADRRQPAHADCKLGLRRFAGQVLRIADLPRHPPGSSPLYRLSIAYPAALLKPWADHPGDDAGEHRSP
jgi:hypothetical protein